MSDSVLEQAAQDDNSDHEESLEWVETELADPDPRAHSQGITHHSLACGAQRSTDSSTFLPKMTSASTLVRVAFFNEDGGRIAISQFYDKGPSNSYSVWGATIYCNRPGVARSLVVWKLPDADLTWRSWANC